MSAAAGNTPGNAPPRIRLDPVPAATLSSPRRTGTAPHAPAGISEFWRHCGLNGRRNAGRRVRFTQSGGHVVPRTIPRTAR
jgi:hypothetical protein